MLANMTQEQTDRENREHCKRIAEELDAIAEGKIYKCPECGELIELDEGHENENGDALHVCPVCGAEYEEDDAEQVSMWDYFSDVLDVEYTVDSRKEYRGARLMVAYGGPNIYVDTMEEAVRLYWCTDRAEYPLSSSTVEAINEFGEELYNC